MKKFSDKSQPSKKAGAFRRIFAVVTGSVMLYRAVKRKKVLKGLGAGLLIAKGVTGLGLLKNK